MMSIQADQVVGHGLGMQLLQHLFMKLLAKLLRTTDMKYWVRRRPTFTVSSMYHDIAIS